MEEIETTAKLKITIKWENFYGYLQLLRKQKSSEKKSQDEILKISNYFLISPEHIFKGESSAQDSQCRYDRNKVSGRKRVSAMPAVEG